MAIISDSNSPSDNLRGAGWIVGSCIYATVMVTLIKYVSGELHSTVIVLGRSVFGLVLIIPVILSAGLGVLASQQWKLHVIRGVMVAIAVNLGFYSLTRLPITTVTVLFFTAPLFVTIIAHYFLDEPVGWRRMSATMIGFVGAVIVTNPTADVFDLRMLLPVISSVFFSISLVLHKQLSKTDSPSVLMFFMFVLTLLCTMPLAGSNWITPTSSEFIILIAIAGFSTLRTYSDIRGYTLGEVSFVAPFQYLRIIFVGAAAYLVFSEVPEQHVIIGALVIISSTLYIAQREYRLNRKRSALPATP